jgi:23S rRNA pseudoU1915 N3-methylase RlmH
MEILAVGREEDETMEKEMSEKQEEIYNRMKSNFVELAGHEMEDNSEFGIRFKVLASEIADIEEAIENLKYQTEMEKENNPLTLEELRKMDADVENPHWVWIKVLKPFGYSEKVSAYYQTHECGTADGAMKRTFWCGYPGLIFGFDYADYGKTWIAYARKPMKK